MCTGPPSIATLANNNCHTFGTNFYNHCQYSNLSQHKDTPTNSTTTPLAGTPPTPYPSTPSPLSIYVGGHHIFLTIIPIGKYMHTPPYTPSLYLHVDLQQHHLGKFLYNILLD